MKRFLIAALRDVWIPILLCLAFFGGCAMAENTYQIAWDWPTNTTTAATMQRYPWLRLEPERVDLDLSFDAGENWSRLATGIPSAYGTNTYAVSLPDDPAWLSTNALVRIQSRQRYAQPQAAVQVGIQIAGLHYVTPPAAVTNGTQVNLRWVAAGAGALLQLGYQVTGAQRWQPLAVLGSQDSSRGATTNTATWYVEGLQPGPGRIVLQSMEDLNVSRIHPLEVLP